MCLTLGLSKELFMDNNGEYTFLVDEAHNLSLTELEKCFSCEFHKKPLLELKREIKGLDVNLYKV